MLEQFKKRIQNKQAIVGIVGLGYVGLPLMIRFAQEKFRVVGFDIDAVKVKSLGEGKSYIQHIPDENIQAIKPYFEVTTDFARINEVDAIILCVPTPLNKYREPDLSYVINTLNTCLPYLRKGQLLSLESTTYPGTTEEELKPPIEAKGFKIGEDFFLIYSPEREDPGNPKYNTYNIPKVCGGVTQSCLEAGQLLYASVIKTVVPVSSPAAAEMTKLLENIHRAVNIGLVNEMKVVADQMGIDIHEVIKAASTKPFGFVPYYPGPGIGGHCIPIDPFYLTWKAREYHIHTRFIELAGEINSYMPHWVVQKIIHALNERAKPVKGSRMLILGIAYKRDVDDMRESPSLTLLELLESRGALVEYSDPHVPRFPMMREHYHELQSVELTAKVIQSYDCVIVATAHSKFDYELIKKHAQLIVDTRGVYSEHDEHIVRA